MFYFGKTPAYWSDTFISHFDTIINCIPITNCIITGKLAVQSWVINAPSTILIAITIAIS